MILIVFVANAVNLFFATAVLTESIYMLVSTGAVLGLMVLEQGARRPWVNTIIALVSYTLVGISYYIRYAGLFLIIAVLSYTVVQFLIQRNRLRTVCIIASLIPMVIAGAIMWRNIVTVGTWRGGNDMRVDNPLIGVAANYVRAHIHLILGQHPFRFGYSEKLLLLGGFGVAALLIAAIGNEKWRRPDNAVLLIGCCIAIYSAGIFYAGLRTPISFGTRMFLPILPLYLLLLGLGLSWLIDRWPSGWPGIVLKSAILLCTVGYLGSNARDLRDPPKLSQYQILAKEYAKPTTGGPTMLDWLDSHVLPANVVFAEDGQATGYLLRRPTVSLVGPQYSPVRWECETVKREMKRFGAPYLILYKASSDIDDLELLASSKFLASAVSQGSACGFVVVAENPDVRILELPGAAN